MSYAAVNGSNAFSPSLAADVQSLNHLKYQAGTGTDSAQTIKETAKQFESLFMRELLKSMRDANNSMKSGMLDSAGGDMSTDLLDQQFSVQMSGQPGGLSDLIAAQLTRQAGSHSTPATAGAAGAASGLDNAATGAASNASTGSTNATTAAADAAGATGVTRLHHHTGSSSATPSGATGATGTMGANGTPTKHRQPTAAQVSFVTQHAQTAARVAASSGIPANYMLGQAANETGWGQHEIKLKGGAPSYNLFGIKAGANWTGKVAEVTTTEYTNGVAQKKVARFRAYDSYDESFKDYANLISNSPRYAQAKLQTTSPQAFASGLQKAGYATDPEYANKLSRAINTTLQLRRVLV